MKMNFLGQLRQSRTGQFSSVCIATVVCLAPSASFAQDAAVNKALEEIVVMAQRREQLVQDVPAAVSAFSANALAANRITSVADLNSLVPNLRVRTTPGGSSLPNYTIRGLVASGAVTGSDKGVAIYLDGVYLGANSGSLYELAELERVEVLRGPQGTLFGRNSTGGAISFVTAEPTGELEVKHNLTFGNHNILRSTTTLNTPAVGPFSARVSYTHSERRGDIRNLGAGTQWNFAPANGGRPATFTSPKWLGSNNLEAIAVAVRFEPSDALKMVYRYDYTDQRYTQNGVGSTYQQPFVRGIVLSQANQALMTPVTSKRPSAVNNWSTVPAHLTAWGHSLTTEIKVSDSFTIKDILAYRKAEVRAPTSDSLGLGGVLNTGSPTFMGLLGAPVAQSTIGAPYFFALSSTEINEDSQWSNELQAVYDSNFVTLTTGALYYHQKVNKGGWGEETGLGTVRNGSNFVYPNFTLPYVGQPLSAGGRNSIVRIRSSAAYAYGEFHLTPQFNLAGGLRYTWDRKSGIDNGNVALSGGIGVPLHYRDGRLTYTIVADYEITPAALLYAKYATGYISGGSLSGLEYDPETAKSWEAGLKADWFGGTLRTNLSVFTVAYGKLQQATSGAALTPPQPQIPLAVVNAGDARSKGAELEVAYAPTSHLTFTAGLGYLDFKFTKVSPALSLGNSQILAPYRPKWNGSAALQYRSDPLIGDTRFVAGIDTTWQSQSTGLTGVRTLADPAEMARYKAGGVIAAHAIVNSRLGLEGFELGGAHANISLWARNLFNNKDIAFLQSRVTAHVADYERARTIGVDLRIEY